MEQAAVVRHLCQSELFADLPAATLRRLALAAQSRSVAAGGVVFLEHDNATGAWLLVHGQARLVKTAATGREHTLRLLRAGDLCAEVALFAGGTYPASLLAVSDCELLLLPAAGLLRLLDNDPVLARQIIAMLSRRIRHLVTMIEDLSLKKVSARLAKYLLDHALRRGALRPGVTVALDLPKHALAATLGTIPETLSRTLQKMARQKIVRNQRRAVTLLNPARLQQLAAGDKL
ncbi:MAG TPA: Crp/Fnr family transcriptional regulator [bacterium]|nr:Crp/Fnr family transcriptional regulator [bacterium]